MYILYIYIYIHTVYLCVLYIYIYILCIQLRLHSAKKWSFRNCVKFAPVLRMGYCLLFENMCLDFHLFRLHLVTKISRKITWFILVTLPLVRKSHEISEVYLGQNISIPKFQVLVFNKFQVQSFLPVGVM